MSEDKNQVVAQRVTDAIDCLKNNKFTFYFFVVDSKGVPNGSLSYIYGIAKTLHDNGYNVQMLYQITDEYTANELHQLQKKDKPIDQSKMFVGVGSWLGEEYAELPHMNISVDELKVGPYDFLFIPEAFASLMYQTYKYNAPCKRIVILENYNYTMDFIPLGVEWKDYGIHDALAISDAQASLIKNVFPYVKTRTLSPFIPPYFRKPLVAKNLIVNVVAKHQEDINRVIKPFFWKYPVMKFVTFRDLRNLPRQDFAKQLQEGAITIWLDEETPFGYSALESMQCGSIVLGKIPNVIPGWMIADEEKLQNNGFWTYDINQIPDMLARIVNAWLKDEIPASIYESMDNTSKQFSFETFEKNTLETFKSLIDEQIKTFEEVYTAVNNETNKTEE